jgi:hypothetical protein
MKSLPYITVLLASLFFAPISLSAAVISMSSQKSSFVTGEEFLVQAYIDTKDASVNAIEGSFLYPSNLLDLTGVRIGDSVISVWIEQPTSTSEGSISFSGIIPGGYSSPQGLLSTFVFRAKARGEGAIAVRDIHAVENNADATALPSTGKSLAFTVSSLDSGESPKEAPIKDYDAPENFSIEIARDTSLYGGQAFLVFATQDKGSGVAGYEVKEGMWGTWQKAESPYPLSDQTLTKKIYVKAVDTNGNTRISVAYGEHYKPWYRNYATFVLVFVLLCVLLWSARGKRT